MFMLAIVVFALSAIEVAAVDAPMKGEVFTPQTCPKPAPMVTKDTWQSGEWSGYGWYIWDYAYYNYCKSQVIYHSDWMMGAPCVISSIEFYSFNASPTRYLKIYLGHTTEDFFGDAKGFLPNPPLVFEGDVAWIDGDFTEITLDTPFDYDGLSNLLLVIEDWTGDYESTHYIVGDTLIDVPVTAFGYSDDTTPDGLTPDSGYYAGYYTQFPVTWWTYSIPLTSIYEIQYTEDPGEGTYPSPLDGEIVTTTGIVTGVKSNDNFWLEEYAGDGKNDFGGAWHGIFVYNFDIEPSVGDSLTLTGEVAEYYGMTQLKNISEWTIHSSGHTPPGPTDIFTGELGEDDKDAASAEPYEGCLVKVMGATVTQEVDEHGQWYADDGTGECQIDDLMYDCEPPLGTLCEFIIGCVDYSYDEYAINPRDESDVSYGTDYDAAVEGLPNEGDPAFENDTLDAGVFDPFVDVKNNSPPGGPTISFVVYYKVMDENGNLVASKSANVWNLAPEEQRTVYFQGGIPLMYSGSYTAVVIIQTAFTDPDMDNNISTRYFEVISGAKSGVELIPSEFALCDCEPNPIQGNALIRYELPERVFVSLKIYDSSGRLVKTLVDGEKSAGYHDVSFRPPHQGVYFARFSAGEFNATKRIIAIR